MERDQEREEKLDIHNDPNLGQPDNLPKGNINTAGEGTRNGDNQDPKETTKKVAFIAIALLILFLLAFGIVRILPTIITSIAGSGSGLSSIFSSREELTATINPTSIVSGEEFSLSWKHKGATSAGKYTFTYQCGPNFYIEHKYPNGRTEKVICDTPFVLPNRDIPLTFNAFLTEENDFADIPLFVNFVEDGTNSAKLTAKATLTIKNGRGAEVGTTENNSQNQPEATSTPSIGRTTPSNISATTSQATSTKKSTGFHVGDYAWGNGQTSQNTSSSTNRTSNTNSANVSSGYKVGDYRWGGSTTNTNTGSSYSENSGATISTGKADLIARNPIVGTINPTTNAFIPGGKSSSGSRVAIQFEVTNIGGQASGSWKLTAILPTNADQTVNSQPQTSLRPGDKMIFTLSFDNLVYKADSSVVVHLDPANTVAESNENNNTLFIPIKQDVGSTGNKPDLVINIINYNVHGDSADIRFEIKNKGAQFSQNWVFKVLLPFDQTFTSNTQSGMNAGESREYTASYSNANNDSSQKITIEVDTTKKVSESNETNNEDSVTIRN